MARAIEHKDLLGNPINVTSILAVSHRNTLKICSIIKLTNKMMRVKPIGKRFYSPDSGYLVRPDDTVVVDGPDVMAYILRDG